MQIIGLSLMVTDLKIFLWKTDKPYGGAFFCPVFIIWTILVDFLKAMLHTKYQKSGPYNFREEDFLKILLWKTDKARGRAILSPGVIIWTILVDVYKPMLHTRYQRSEPYSYRDEDF